MDDTGIFRLLNREVLLLVGLALLAFFVFAFTRRMAVAERQREAQVAAVWYERGERAMKTGQTDAAVQAFRKATADEGAERKYLVALARALMAANKDSEAQNLLLQLRESDPEDAEININLARLSAKQGALQAAVHYYQNAMYGRWPVDATESRRQLRVELVRYLIAQKQFNLASSELLILQGNTPDTAAARIEVAQLYMQAGDYRRALQEFDSAAGTDPGNFAALFGAGSAAFNLQDYPQAARYLHSAVQVNPNVPEAVRLLSLSELVQNGDPLAAGLTSAERLRRLNLALDSSAQRLDACLVASPTPLNLADLQQLKNDLQSSRDLLKQGPSSPDYDAVRAEMGLVFRIQRAASLCAVPKSEDEALLLMVGDRDGARP